MDLNNEYCPHGCMYEINCYECAAALEKVPDIPKSSTVVDTTDIIEFLASLSDKPQSRADVFSVLNKTAECYYESISHNSRFNNSRVFFDACSHGLSISSCKVCNKLYIIPYNNPFKTK